MNDDKIKYPDDESGPDNIVGEKVFGLFKTVTIVPTDTPKNWFDQIVLFSNGSVKKLYFYDNVGGVWVQLWTGNITGTGATTVSQNTTTITIHS